MFGRIKTFFTTRENRPTIAVVTFFLIALIYFLFALGMLHLPSITGGSGKEDISPTPSPTEAPSPTEEPTPTEEVVPTKKKFVPTSTPKPTATNTPAPTSAPTNTPTPTVSVSPAPSVSITPAETPSVSPSP